MYLPHGVCLRNSHCVKYTVDQIIEEIIDDNIINLFSKMTGMKVQCNI